MKAFVDWYVEVMRDGFLAILLLLLLGAFLLHRCFAFLGRHLLAYARILKQSKRYRLNEMETS